MSYAQTGLGPYSPRMPRGSGPPPFDDDEFSRRIGAYVKRSLKAKGWGQKRLAAEMRIGPGMITKLTKGNAEWVYKYIRSAAKALGIQEGELFHIGTGTPVHDRTASTGKIEAPRVLPPGLATFLSGEHGDDVSKRERLWLESVLDFTNEPARDAERFWFKLWRVFREREPSGD